MARKNTQDQQRAISYLGARAVDGDGSLGERLSRAIPARGAQPICDGATWDETALSDLSRHRTSLAARRAA